MLPNSVQQPTCCVNGINSVCVCMSTVCSVHSLLSIHNVYYAQCVLHDTQCVLYYTHCAHCDLQCTVVWSIVCRWNKTPPLPPQEEIHTCKVLRRGASFSRKKNSSRQNCPSLIKWPRHQSRRQKTKSTLAKFYMGRLNFFQDI